MSTAPRDGSLKTALSRPPMLPHSLSLGHLPGPNFASLPSGQRSVPATDAFTRLANGDRVSTPTSDGVKTPGAVGERVRRDSFEPWTSENDKLGSLDRIMEVGRRTVQFDNLPTNIGTAAGRASLTDYRRSIVQAESVSPTSTIHPLNRAPGSREGLVNPTSVARKSLGMSATTPTAGLGFNISQSIPESEVVDYRTDSAINGSDKARSASISFDLQGRPNRSHAHNRKVSQPTPANVDQEALIAGIGSMTFNDLSRRRVTESTLPTLRSNGAVSSHRPSLPSSALSSATDGLHNYHGNGASYMSPGVETSPFMGADPGYGLSSDLRRNSYSPHVNSAASSMGNLRRSQSAWHIHDAFSPNAAPSRQPSLSYGTPLGRTPAPFLQNPFGANPQAAYTGKSSPTMSPLDLPRNAAVNGLLAGSSLLAQQQLLNEMRRQSLARQALELSQLGLINPFGLGYGVQPLAQNALAQSALAQNALAQNALAQNALAQNALSQNALSQNALSQNVLSQNGAVPCAYPATSNRTSFESTKGAQRSVILEEFRSNKHRRWELKDMLGHIVEFAGDQLGSRHIQSKLDAATPEEKELVFAEIFPNMLQLSMDVFANYVVQKFFEQGNQSQKAKLADALRGHVLQLSLQMYGCRVVQKALEHVLVDQQHALIKELEGEVMQCAKDQNANHVLQRSLELIDPTTNQFITQAFLGQAFTLATHAYGCRVLQRVFEHSAPTQSRPLLEELHRFSHNLMTDQYGNYVAQWIITDGQPEDAALMISKVKGQTLQLSKHKFASNVVEKAVLKGTPDDLRFMIDEILTPRNDGASTIGIMLKDAFANFPLQKFLLMAREPQRSMLFKETAAQLTQMRKYSLSYGKYLVALERLVTNELGPFVDDISFATAGPAPESA